jgi:thiol-disulfide isomerase/thioredoxin
MEKKKSLTNLIVLIFWIFLIFLFLNELFTNTTKTDETFKNTNNNITVYNFNTSWCGHSLRFQPSWDNFVKSLSKNDNIKTIDAKCDTNKYDNLVKKYNVEGYPTVIIDYGNKFIKYNGNRTVNGLRNALELSSIDDETKYNDMPSNHRCGGPTNQEHKMGNQEPTKMGNQELAKTKIYNFNTSWCGYSVKFQPIWDNFAERINDPNIKVIDVKCDNKSNAELCEKYDVPGYPSVVKVDSSNKVTHYNGPRTVEGLINFCK